MVAELVCDDNKAFSFLNSQLGKKYDTTAIFGVFFRTGWENKNKWFCSELVAAASGAFRKNRVGRITPEHIWAITK